MNCERIKIAIADPWQYSREHLENFIAKNSRFQLLATGQDGCDLLQKLDPQNLPHVLITELDMPRMDGIALCLRFDSEYPQIGKMMLTHCIDPYAVRQILETNILGMIPKNTDNAEVTVCIEAVSKGHLHICSPYSELKQRIKNQPKPRPYDQLVLQLSYEGHSNKEIATLTNKSKDSVKLSKKRLHKLSGHNQPELFKWAEDIGFVRRKKMGDRRGIGNRYVHF